MGKLGIRLPQAERQRRLIHTLQGLADGHTLDDVAEQLGLPPGTLRTVFYYHMHKDGIHSSCQYVAEAFRRGWIR